MAIRLHFWGAAQSVTGSSHHIECAGQNVLLDCGLFQGRRQDAANINSHLAVTPEQLAAGGLNAVVLSHAHIDHSGGLPLLAQQGYRGPIYTTPATVVGTQRAATPFESVLAYLDYCKKTRLLQKVQYPKM